KGTAYQFDLMSKQFDAFMRLEDDAGKQIAEDDDGGDRLNSRIRYTAEKDATYKVYATTFRGGEGNHNLTGKSFGTASRKGGGATELPLPTATKPAKHDGQLLPTDPPDSFRKLPAKLYTVELKAGKTYVIDLISTDFDCFLRLESPDGNRIADDDDGGEGLN